MGRNAGNVVLPALMVLYYLIDFRFIIFDRFFLIFKVTAIVMRLTDVVLVSPVTWEFDVKSLALKVFSHY